MAETPRNAKASHYSAADETWNARFRELLEYREEHGNSAVPQHYKHNRKLGSWVAAQRKFYRLLQKGERAPQLNPSRIQQLRQIDFVWYVGRNRKALLAKLEEEKRFKKRKSEPKKFEAVAVTPKKPKIFFTRGKYRSSRCANTCTSNSNKNKNNKCVTPDHETELNDNDLELARLIANFPQFRESSSCSNSPTTNLVLEDEECDDGDDYSSIGRRRETSVYCVQDYQDMSKYLGTIADLQNSISSLQQGLLKTKATTRAIQRDRRMILQRSSSSSQSSKQRESIILQRLPITTA